MEIEGKKINKYDFLPISICIETLGGISTPLVKRGTPLPTKRSQVFSTATDNQPSVEIHVLLGERPLAKNNFSVGRCQLKGIKPALRGIPQIRVLFEVDTKCNIKVAASDSNSGEKIETNFEKAQIELNDEIIHTLITDSQSNKTKDDAFLTIQEAELEIQNAQYKNAITPTTKNLENIISKLGVAIMEDDIVEILKKTSELRTLLETSKKVNSPLGFGSYDNLFDSLFGPTQSIKQNKPIAKSPTSQSQQQETKKSTPATTPSTHITAIIQNFLEEIDPELEIKRSGAWQALENGTFDGPSQASHSMREVLRQLLDKIAPESEVEKAPWYKKSKDGPSVTRNMRIHYAIAGKSSVESESTLSLISGMSETVNSMYAKLSAESHSDKRVKTSSVRMYLNACESLIGLIATERNK